MKDQTSLSLGYCGAGDSVKASPSALLPLMKEQLQISKQAGFKGARNRDETPSFLVQGAQVSQILMPIDGDEVKPVREGSHERSRDSSFLPKRGTKLTSSGHLV